MVGIYFLNKKICILILVAGFISTVSTVSAIKKDGSFKSSNKTETIEGSANGHNTLLPDSETDGSGYPTDDEDGDSIHGSGDMIDVSSKYNAKKVEKTRLQPDLTTQSVSTTVSYSSAKPKNDERHTYPANTHELDDNDDEEENEDEFDDEIIHDDVSYVVTPTSKSPTRRIEDDITTTTPAFTNVLVKESTTTSSSPFAPFHETIRNGAYAAVAGIALIAIITAILLIMFVVFRIRKKDEGSYALDEPKQARPYATYAYTKASTKEFYA